MFEPPLDMSQYVDSCEHQHLKNVPTSGRVSVPKSDEGSCGDGSNLTCRPPDVVTVSEVNLAFFIIFFDNNRC